MTREFPFPLPTGWFHVAYAEELSADSIRPLHYFDRDLIAFRDAAGRARVLDAHCPHLGAHLGHGGEIVEGGRVRCPFHHWEFDGEGMCTRVPYAEKIPPKARLRSWPVEEKNGCVYVYFDEPGREPGFVVPEVAEHDSPEWTRPIRRDWVVRSCAQEMAENSVDPAHFRSVHRTAEVPQVKAWAEGPVFRANLDYPVTIGDAVQHGSIDIYAHGLGMGVSYFRGIVETVVLVSGTPIDTGRVHHRLGFLVKKTDSEELTQRVAEAFSSEIARQFDEDIPIWENKIYHERPVLSDGDGPIGEIRRWARQFYAADGE